MIVGTGPDGSIATFFRARVDHGTEFLVPGERARSGWKGEGQIRGAAVSGALARAAERAAAGYDDAARFRPVRWTVDLFRPAPMAPVTTATTVVRRGRRLRLVDATLLHDDVAVARASALLIATDNPPADGRVWAAPDDATGTCPPPDPALRPATTEQTLFFSEGRGWTGDAAPHANAARKATWHVPEALVEGETPSPFQRIAATADSSNLAGNWGDHGVEFINADLTLAISRLPVPDSGIGILAEDRQDGDGIAVVRTCLFDRLGPLGTVLLSSLANTAASVDPSTVGTPTWL